MKRFWDKVSKSEGCWNWIAYTDERGYGTFRLNGKMVKAHRVSYELVKGKIPNGLVIDHLCRNTSCVNPSHLEPVTNRENVMRGVSPKITSERQRSKTHCPSGHEYNKENTRVQAKGYRKCKVCHREWERERRIKQRRLNDERTTV